MRRLPFIEATLGAYQRPLPMEIRESDSMDSQNSHPPAPRKERVENSC
jgi:hypothetical protein